MYSQYLCVCECVYNVTENVHNYQMLIYRTQGLKRLLLRAFTQWLLPAQRERKSGRSSTGTYSPSKIQIPCESREMEQPQIHAPVEFYAEFGSSDLGSHLLAQIGLHLQIKCWREGEKRRSNYYGEVDSLQCLLDLVTGSPTRSLNYFD